MTVLPQPSAFMQFDRADWLPVSVVAHALGKDRDHLTRQCRQQLQASGMAILDTLGNGRTGWLIHRNFDPRLRTVDAAIDLPHLDDYTERQRMTAWAKWDCVCRYRQAKRERGGSIKTWMPAFIAELTAAVIDPLNDRHGTTLTLSYGSLRRWDKDAPTITDLPNLIDQRGGDQRSQGSDEFWQAFASLYLTDDRRTAKACWRRARD